MRLSLLILRLVRSRAEDNRRGTHHHDPLGWGTNLFHRSEEAVPAPADGFDEPRLAGTVIQR